VEVVDTELELLNKIVDVVVDLDPDIITGWEVQAASWGYLNFRGQQYGQSPSLIFGVS
jgi:DNA polymerase zeta